MRRIFPLLRPHLRVLLLLAAVCVVASSLKLAFIGTTYNSDYESYIQTAQLFSGMPAEEFPQRILKPLAPLVVASIAPATGFAPAFMAVTLFFYLAFAFALYALAILFLGNRRLAFIATLFSILSYPVLRYGIDLYTETGGIFFYIASLALTLWYLKAPSFRILAANALVIGLGLLWKEYSLINGLIFGLALLFERVPLGRKAANLALLGILSLLLSIMAQAWVYARYGYSYLDWYVSGGAAGFATEFTLVNLVKSTGSVLGLAWLLVPGGLLMFRALTDAQKRFLVFAIPPSFACFFWGYVSSRLFYVMAPAFILVAMLGLSRLPISWQRLVTAIILAANIGWLIIATR